jgi:hypothetical protein
MRFFPHSRAADVRPRHLPGYFTGCNERNNRVGRLVEVRDTGLVQLALRTHCLVWQPEGTSMSIRVSGNGGTPWHPPASLQRRGLRWLFLPLIAFAIFAAGPSLITPILYIVHLIFDLSAYLGAVQGGPGPLSLLLEPLVLTIALWPFLAVYSTARDRLIAQPATWRSIRLATIGATLAMSLPSTIFLVGVPQEMLSSARDAGQGTGIVIFLFMFLLPLLGTFGWLTGRGIARMLRL